jgi:phenylalanine ammonia-lyase
MLLLAFLGNSLVDRFPVHVEQFNQNINSQGLGSANLARQSSELPLILRPVDASRLPWTRC